MSGSSWNVITADPLSEQEERLIERLRNEATGVKECFTRFSFQAMAFAAISFGVTSHLGTPASISSVTTLAVIVFLLAVVRIGIYKYSSANRHYGYELHLHRSRFFPDETTRWKREMRQIGWEEAMRAWRIVQASIFEKIYHVPRTSKLRLHPRAYLLTRTARPSVTDNNRRYCWYLPSELVEGTNKAARYYAGSYLQVMALVLHFMALLSLVLLAYPLFSEELARITSNPTTWLLLLPRRISVFGLIVFAVAVVALYYMWTQQRRILILEEGLLSIHSCSVMWQAVVLAHFLALERQREAGESIPYRGYTEALGIVITDLLQDVKRIHDWVDGTLPGSGAPQTAQAP